MISLRAATPGSLHAGVRSDFGQAPSPFDGAAKLGETGESRASRGRGDDSSDDFGGREFVPLGG
jgi:hypothetical protein